MDMPNLIHLINATNPDACLCKRELIRVGGGASGVIDSNLLDGGCQTNEKRADPKYQSIAFS